MTVIIKAGRWKTAPNYNVALAPEFIRPSFSGLITPFNGKTTYQSGAVLKASSGGIGLGASSGNGWQAGTSRVLAGEDKSTLIIAVGTNYGTSSYMGKAYCERSEGTQIFKFGFSGESAPRAHFVWRNSSSQLISLVGDSVPDAELRPVSIMAAVVNGSASRTVYLNGIKNTDTTNYANTFTAANDVRICGDAQDAGETFSHNVFWVLRYKEALPFAFLDELVSSPFSIFRREKSRIYFFPSAGGGGATLTADSGTYTLTGTAATLKADRKLAADSGSYAITGTDVSLKLGRKLTAESGTYTVNGTDVSLTAGRKLTADSGTYALTGTDVTLTYQPAGGYTLALDSGSYTLTGTAATLKASRKLTADSGTYALTGTDVTLTRGFKITADSGTYTLTGSNVAFARTYRLPADSGSYALSGSPVSLSWSGEVVPVAPTHGGPSIYGKAVFREAEFKREYEREVSRIENERIRAIQMREDEELVIIMAALAA